MPCPGDTPCAHARERRRGLRRRQPQGRHRSNQIDVLELGKHIFDRECWTKPLWCRGWGGPGFYETDGISLAVVSIPVPVIRHFCATHLKLEEHIMKYLVLINTPSPDSAE